MSLPRIKGSRRNQLDAVDRLEMQRVGAIIVCCGCGAHAQDLEVSHCPMNWSGKGMGIKGHPTLLARLCKPCHTSIDQHKDDWELRWLEAYARTQALLYDNDKLTATGQYSEYVE